MCFSKKYKFVSFSKNIQICIFWGIQKLTTLYFFTYKKYVCPKPPTFLGSESVSKLILKLDPKLDSNLILCPWPFLLLEKRVGKLTRVDQTGREHALNRSSHPGGIACDPATDCTAILKITLIKNIFFHPLASLLSIRKSVN